MRTKESHRESDIFNILQIYLALYLGLVPLNETFQSEVIPVVRLRLSQIRALHISTQRTNDMVISH